MRTALSIALACALACAGPATTPRSVEPIVQIGTPSEDLQPLADRVALPEGATGRWVSRVTSPGGTSWIPGPSDPSLVAWIEADPASLEVAYGPAVARAQTLEISPAIARAIVPPERLDALATDKDGQRLLPSTHRHDVARASRGTWTVTQLAVVEGGVYLVAVQL